MACATSIVKYLLFLFNLFCALAGLAFLVVGVIFKLNFDDYTEQLKDTNGTISLAPTLLIVLGCIIFVIAFLGCCGAVRESTCMLTSYAIVLLVLLILQVGLGVYAFISFNDDQKEFKDELKANLDKIFREYKDDNKGVKEFVDSLQHGLQCCGVNGPLDWMSLVQITIPSSCCEDNSEGCTALTSYQKGCFNKLWEFIQDGSEVLGIVVLTVGLTELVAAVIGLCLSSSIRNERRRYYS